jgi:hypothetical protein
MFVLALIIFCTWGVQNIKVCLPLLFIRRGRYSFEQDQDAITQPEWPENTRELIDGLARLEFKPLGIKVEARPFQRLKELAFASVERQAFAAIHGHDRGAPHYYFYTPYEDGSVVLTSDIPMETVRTDRFIHTGVPGAEMSEVWAQHARNSQKMARPGRQPYATYDQETRIRATKAYYDNPGSGIIAHTIMVNALRNSGICLVLLVLATGVLLWRWLPVILTLKLV